MENYEVLRELEKSLMLENKSKGTLERYTSNIKKLMNYYEGKKLSELTEDELRCYAFSLHQKGLAPSTYNNHIASIKYVYRKVLFKRINENKIPFKRNKKKEVIIPNNEEIVKIINSSEVKEIRLIVMLVATSGLRISEAIKIKAEDIKADRNQLRVIGKGQKERWVPIEEMVIEELRQYWLKEREKIEGNNYIFARRNYQGYIKSDYVSRELRKLMKKINLRNYTMHTIRHAFATQVYNQTKDIEYVGKIMGHDLIATTEGYIHSKEIEYKIKSPVIEALDQRNESL